MPTLHSVRAQPWHWQWPLLTLSDIPQEPPWSQKTTVANFRDLLHVFLLSVGHASIVPTAVYCLRFNNWKKIPLFHARNVITTMYHQKDRARAQDVWLRNIAKLSARKIVEIVDQSVCACKDCCWCRLLEAGFIAWQGLFFQNKRIFH